MKSMKLFKLLAIALPVALFASCFKADPDEGLISQFISDGEKYILESWINYDAVGNMAGSVYGIAIDESNPTVRVIYVKNLQEAQNHFRYILAPHDAKVIADGDNMTVQLTDTEGNVKNNLFFNAVNDGKILARVTLEKEVGVEQFVTEFHYMIEGDGSEYKIIGGDCPFQEGNIYKHSTDGRHYLCMCLPSSDGTGLLVGDINFYKIIETNTKRGSEQECVNMPRHDIFDRIWTILNKKLDAVGSALYWQRLCATSGKYVYNKEKKIYEYKLVTSSVPDFKTRVYWVNEMPNDDEDITIYNLVNGCLGALEPGYWWDDTYEWVLNAYKFYYNDKGELVVERCTTLEIWSSKWEDKWPAVSTFSRDLEVEKMAESISLQ